MFTHPHYFFLYILLMSICGFAFMYVDKLKARKKKWRIPEKTLFLIAILGGSPGAILGMHLFRHKTKHWYFVIGMPVILMIQISCFIYLALH